MAFDRSAVVARARRVVHAVHGLAATYEDAETPPVLLTIGRFNRQVVHGNMIEAGYTDVVEGIDRVRFNIEELAEKNVSLQRGGIVRLRDPLERCVALVLEHEEPSTGPINVIWGVTVLHEPS